MITRNSVVKIQNPVMNLESEHIKSNFEADIVCADHFKVTIFWKKQFVKNGSFTNFWLVGSRN